MTHQVMCKNIAKTEFILGLISLMIDAIAILAGMARNRVLTTFAPRTPALTVMHVVGRMLPHREHRAPAIEPASEYKLLAGIGEHYHGPVSFVLHAFGGPAIYLAIAGVVTAWYIYMKNPDIADNISRRFRGIYELLINKYYADEFNDFVFAGGARGVGRLLWRIGDSIIIDGLIVNGSAKLVGWVAGVVRHVQTGYLYHYAFSMIIGLLLMLGWFVFLSGGAA